MKKTPISYYGGKQNLVKTILPMIPHHLQYVEPFCGGAAVFFAKGKSKHEIINDKNEWVTTFFRQMKTNFDELERMIYGTAHAESEHKKSKDILLNGGSDLEIAWAFWVQTTMSFTNKIFSGFAFGNYSRAPITNNKRNQFKQYKNRLDNVEIFNRDAVDLIKLKDSKDTFFYIDPPYVSSNQGHYSGYTSEDFTNLLEVLSKIKGKFLLSSYPEPGLMEYRKKNNWNVRDLKQIVLVNGKRKETKNKTECLTWNYELNQTKLF